MNFAQSITSRRTAADFSLNRRGVRKAFTLLELLIVIVIIAVLASLLLPALANAKAKGRRIDCQSRLKQWHLAFTMYAEDYDDWIPRESYEPKGETTINNWTQVKGKPQPNGGTDSQDVWYNSLPPYLQLPPTSSFAARPDRKNFYDKNLIHCPAAKFPSHAFRDNYLFPLFSVAMNSQLIQTGPSVKMSAIESRDPVRTVIFLDNLLEGEKKVHPAQENSHLGQPGAWASRFGARHENGGNLVFGDGHVTWLPGNRVVETDNNSPLRGGPILPPRDVVWELYPF